MVTVYDDVYTRSMSAPEDFWAAAAEDIHWERRWDRVFDDARPPFYRWFVGGTLNTCYNALDLHVDRGRGKILRGTMKKIADGAAYGVPATIDDPAILDEITEALQTIGYPKRG